MHFDRAIEAQAELLDLLLDFALALDERLEDLVQLRRLRLDLGDVGKGRANLSGDMVDPADLVGALFAVVVSFGTKNAKLALDLGFVRVNGLANVLGGLIDFADLLRYALERRKARLDGADHAVGEFELLRDLVHLAAKHLDLDLGLLLFLAAEPNLLFEEVEGVAADFCFAGHRG